MAKPRDGGIGGQATGQRTASKSRKIGKRRSKASAAPTRLRPPERGATVRMYRHGHGDCFLLAFRGEDGQPVYVLIDGGYKPGSNGDTFGLADFPTVVEDIAAATGKRLDLVIVTHEHQDHVNGLADIAQAVESIGAAWFGWTEDPSDPLADELRRRYHDQLVGLVAARGRLAASGNPGYLDELLSLELGVDDPGLFGLAAREKQEKKATSRSTGYIRPHQEVLRIPGVKGVRVYALGPPHRADLLSDEDPQGSEAFPGHAVSASSSFMAAARLDDALGDRRALQPFSTRFAQPLDAVFDEQQYKSDFFRRHYGKDGIPEEPAPKRDQADESDKSRSECALNPAWRRIDQEWLSSAEDLALVLNKGINNTSLVLAFELEQSGKVLLFVGDAQRGNWKSWTDGSWKPDRDAKEITARDLLARTVLYKVGHHGSHNATLSGTADSDYPCLAWMGQGKFGDEFTAMITAVNKWALAVKPKPWVHPLPSIRKALAEKTDGRVLQIDTPIGPSDPSWSKFEGRLRVDSGGLYFEYDVTE